MSDLLLLFVSDYGIVVIFVATILSCLGLPSPASLIMMAGGAFAATDDLDLWAVCIAAFLGAALGDQSLYWMVRQGGGVRFWKWLAGRKGAWRLMANAETFLDRRGGWAVFLSRWLFSPLAPYVTLSAGATEMRWSRFTAANMSGEAIWVALYVSLGYFFTTRIEEVSETLGSVIGFLTAGLITLGLWLLYRQARQNRRDED
jgi:membrane protein DedA with SNARE-associated domain